MDECHFSYITKLKNKKPWGETPSGSFNYAENVSVLDST
jgi:hypothetical protein